MLSAFLSLPSVFRAPGAYAMRRSPRGSRAAEPPAAALPSIDPLPSRPNLHEMRTLRLWNCDSATIPNKVWHLHLLETLELCGSARLEFVPASIGRLKRLRTLSLAGCTSLRKISDEMGRLESLEVLDLSGCRRLQQVPEDVCRLPRLRLLDLEGCDSLVGLPDLRRLPPGCEVRLPRPADRPDDAPPSSLG
ncbi:MAG: hypothetical protein ABW032_08170 [Burkholderiaceae bacterium]